MNKSTLIYGIHSVESLLRQNPTRIQRIYIQKARHDKKIKLLLELAENAKLTIDFLPQEEMDQLSAYQNHQGIIAFCHTQFIYNEKDLSTLIKNLTSPPFILILDGVQDPHNLGACFRSADAAGVHFIIAPKDKAASITPVVTKVASGATETVPFVQVTNLARTLQQLKEFGIWIYGAAEEAPQSLYQTNLTGPLALVLGAEGSGLRRLTKENCDVLIQIPMQGFVSSLNVSVAAGVLLFEALRQRC